MGSWRDVTGSAPRKTPFHSFSVFIRVHPCQTPFPPGTRATASHDASTDGEAAVPIARKTGPIGESGGFADLS